jgi:AAA domain (dynein-related subfamily)
VGRRDERNRQRLTDMFNYHKRFFDPASLTGFTRTTTADREDWAYDAGSEANPDQRHFVFAEEAVLALNISLATRRPLLISGEPGGGKTSLARFAAHALGHVFYRETVTSRTQASDLLSSFDALQRLGHARHRPMSCRESCGGRSVRSRQAGGAGMSWRMRPPWTIPA